MRLRQIPPMCAVAALLVAGACGGGGGGAPTGATTSSYPSTPSDPTNTAASSVNATAGASFDPGALTVPKGTTVTFSFASLTHNVVFDAVSGAPTNIPNTASATVTRTFASAGAFGYQCTIHSGMRGTITVQ